ncbi:MAG: hypothetical protein ABI551_03070 [Polyangiaceae bacterium]
MLQVGLGAQVLLFGPHTACCKKKACNVDYIGKCANNAEDGCGGTLDCSNNCAPNTFFRIPSG